MEQHVTGSPLERVLVLAAEFFGDKAGSYGIMIEADAGHPVARGDRARPFSEWHASSADRRRTRSQGRCVRRSSRSLKRDRSEHQSRHNLAQR